MNSYLIQVDLNSRLCIIYITVNFIQVSNLYMTKVPLFRLAEGVIWVGQCDCLGEGSVACKL